MAPPPPALPMSNGNLSNGISNNNNNKTTTTPSNHAGLLKEIETGNYLFLFMLMQERSINISKLIFLRCFFAKS